MRPCVMFKHLVRRGKIVLKHSPTSVNNFLFSASNTCLSFFAEAKGDWEMWVAAGSWDLRGEMFLACCSEDEAEEGWGLASSSSSSSTIILSAIQAGATAIRQACCFCDQKVQRDYVWDGKYQTGENVNIRTCEEVTLNLTTDTILESQSWATDSSHIWLKI